MHCVFQKHFVQLARTMNGLEEPIIEVSLAACKRTRAKNDQMIPIKMYMTL